MSEGQLTSASQLFVFVLWIKIKKQLKRVFMPAGLTDRFLSRPSWKWTLKFNNDTHPLLCQLSWLFKDFMSLRSAARVSPSALGYAASAMRSQTAALPLKFWYGSVCVCVDACARDCVCFCFLPDLMSPLRVEAGWVESVCTTKQWLPFSLCFFFFIN